MKLILVTILSISFAGSFINVKAMHGKPPCDISAVARPQDIGYYSGIYGEEPEFIQILFNTLLKKSNEEKTKELNKLSSTTRESLMEYVAQEKKLLEKIAAQIDDLRSSLIATFNTKAQDK